MNKINLIMSKRNRDDRLKLSLHNFNLANKSKKHDVVIYIGEDIKENINKIDYSIYKNLRIEHIYVPNLPEGKHFFCRGYILNILMMKMRQDYDFVCGIDIDMVYRHDFFDQLASILKSGESMESCVFALGNRTTNGVDNSKIYREELDYQTIMSKVSHEDWKGCKSQVSITRAYHEHIKKVLGVKNIFDAAGLGGNFIGYGYEDGLVRKILDFSKVRVVLLGNSWVHVWHEPIEEYDRMYLERNIRLYKLLRKEAYKRLRAGKFYESYILKRFKGALGFRFTRIDADRQLIR